MSTSSGTSIRNGWTSVMVAILAARDRDLGRFGATAQHHRAVGRPLAPLVSVCAVDGGTGGGGSPGRVLAASASRAASLTGSPITVYS